MKMYRGFHRAVALTIGALSLSFGMAQAQAFPPPPSFTQAMQQIYGPGYFPARKLNAQQSRAQGGVAYARPVVRVGKTYERVRPWIGSAFLFEGQPHYVAFGEGYDVSGPVGSGSYNPMASQMTTADVSAIVYRFDGRTWVVRGVYRSLFQSGSGGLLGLEGAKDPMGKPMVTPTGVFFHDDAAAGNNGIFNSFADVVVLTDAGMRYAQAVPTGGDNSGSGMKPSYTYNGHIASLKLDASGKVHADVVFTGRARVTPHGRVVPIGRTSCQMVEDDANQGYVTHQPRCAAILNTGAN